MRENHRSQTAKRITTVAMLSGAAPSSSTSSSDIQSSAAKKPEQESSPQTRRPNQSITAAHPAIYRNTRSHKLLRRAIRIWKMPIPILNFTRSLKPRPRSFQERLKMLSNRSEDSSSPKPMTRSVRDLQLCSSGTDSSPSPSGSSLKPQRHLRSRPLHRSRRYRKQLQLYRMLSSNRRRRLSREKQHKLEGQSSPAASTCVKGSSEVQDDHRDSSSTQSSPVIRAPPRRTSRRLWRRQLDSSSSENSPLTTNPVHSERPDAAEDHRPRAGKKSQSRRVKFSFADVLSESAEFEFSDINTSAIEEASAPAQRNNTDLKPDEESTQISLKITVTNTEEPDSEASLDSQLKIFKDRRDAVEIKQEAVQFKNPSSVAPRHKTSVKWKKVMIQRALCSVTIPSESQEPTHDCWSRLAPADNSDPSDTDRADMKPEGPEKPAADLMKNQAAGDAFIPQ